MSTLSHRSRPTLSTIKLNNYVFSVGTFVNGPTLGKQTKDGNVQYVYYVDQGDQNDHYDQDEFEIFPSLVLKKHHSEGHFIKEFRCLDAIKQRIIMPGICYNFPIVHDPPLASCDYMSLCTTFSGFSSTQWNSLFDLELEDYISLFMQFSYAVSVYRDVLNLSYVDIHPGNIVHMPVPSTGKYKISYVIRSEGTPVLHYELYTRFIHTIVDFSNSEQFNLFVPMDPSLSEIFTRKKRSTSNSSNREMASLKRVFPLLVELYEKGCSIFDISNLSKCGFSPPLFYSSAHGVREWKDIIDKFAQYLEEKQKCDIINIVIDTNIKKDMDTLLFPSFNAFDCKMYIEFIPDIPQESILPKKKRGRPRKYKSNAEKCKYYRLRKKLIGSISPDESSYDLISKSYELFELARRATIRKYTCKPSFSFNFPLDSPLIELRLEGNIIKVYTKKYIGRHTKITEYIGYKTSTPLSKKEFILKDKNVNKEYFIEGIRYPFILGGVGSFIRKAEKRENPNVKFEVKDDRLWAISIGNIDSGYELLC